MKDFSGKELKVGDKIAYVTRQSSYMEVKQTEILEFCKRISWNSKEEDIIIARNPNYKSREYYIDKFNKDRAEALKEDPNHWYYKDRVDPYITYHPKTVTLSCPNYIIKMSDE